MFFLLQKYSFTKATYWKAVWTRYCKHLLNKFLFSLFFKILQKMLYSTSTPNRLKGMVEFIPSVHEGNALFSNVISWKVSNFNCDGYTKSEVYPVLFKQCRLHIPCKWSFWFRPVICSKLVTTETTLRVASCYMLCTMFSFTL